MRVLGLTGSIAMGKSTTAAMIRQLGIPVHDADAAVHRLIGPGGRAVAAVLAAFPGVGTEAAGIDRPALAARVFGDAPGLRRLEAILHPRVQAETRAFLQRMARARRPVVVLDIPLLFETGRDRACDQVIVVSAPAFLQRQRVLRRPGMTDAKLKAILARQMPDAEKRRRADWVVPTGLGRAVAFANLRRILHGIGRWPPGRAWPGAWRDARAAGTKQGTSHARDRA